MWTLALLGLIQAPGDLTYRIQATAPVTLTLPACPEGEGHWIRAAGKRWVRVKAEQAEGALHFRLDPAGWEGGEALLVVGKTKGIDLADEQPPKVTALRVDGARVADAPTVDLDWRVAPPRQILWELEDKSRLNTDTLRILVNGQAFAPGTPGIRVNPSSAGRKLAIAVEPEKLPGMAAPAETRVVLSLSDASPTRNALERALVYRRMAPPEGGKPVAVHVDSCFEGYTPETLVDGKVMEPGATTYGVTWASAETGTPHWVVLVFDKPRAVAGVELYWAHFQGEYMVSSRYAIEAWDGARWRPLAEATGEQPAKSTTHRFAPVTTTAIRIRQPARGGHPGRPHLMWLTEIKPF
ncbi:MAG TPA: discoidin domain-containing protein [Armatimonadetes bacterium]|jgi:hypothetical protein|nr:discoidin domain-containing protein [Armatimonadota bacterium]